MNFAFIRMVHCRGLLVKLKLHWSNFRQSVEPYLNYDYDRCLDLIMVGGGIRSVAGAEPWNRICMTLYRTIGYYQFIVLLVKAGFSIQNKTDTVDTCLSIGIPVQMAGILIKVYILGHYDKAVQQAKDLVNNNFCSSGDHDYDAMVRRDPTRVAGKVTLAIFLLYCCDQVMFWVPSSARDRILDIPKQFHVLGAPAFCLLKGTLLSTIAFFWGCRYSSTTLTIIPLLKGLKNELMIVARKYETIGERGETSTVDDQNNAMKNFKRILGNAVEQHAEVLRKLHQIQPLVNYVYAVTHYSVMFAVSITVFTVIRTDVSLVSLALAATGTVLVIECYFWNHMIESIQETMDLIADSVAPLGSKLQHSVDNHSEYIEMRTSLMIIQLNASQCDWFSCGGIFPISVESFGNMCMIIYKFSTFLLKIE